MTWGAFTNWWWGLTDEERMKRLPGIIILWRVFPSLRKAFQAHKVAVSTSAEMSPDKERNAKSVNLKGEV